MAMDIGVKPQRKGRATPSMNVTPLVDVVLVLLIIFMVITPLLAKQFWLSLPSEPDDSEPVAADERDPPIVVTVMKTGELRINKEAVPRAEFPHKLRRVLAAKQQRTIFFDAEADTAFGDAAEALDLARGGGAATIAVLTTSLDPK